MASEGKKEEVNSRFGVKCSTTPFKIDMDMHSEHRTLVLANLKEQAAASGNAIVANSIILMQGGPTPTFHETDHEPVFRQQSNFHYMFGVMEPDFYGVVEVDSGITHLFAPRLPASYATWMGPIKPLEYFQNTYKVDKVHYTDEIAEVVAGLAPGEVLVQYGLNSDSGLYAEPATFKGIEAFTVDKTKLYNAIVESRMIKTKTEQALMQYVNDISSEAHIAVMRNATAGVKEYQMEAVFRYWNYYHGGARHMSYTCICAAGNNGATLHYGHAGEPNSATLKDGDMCLFDMGGEYHRYGADITCSFPCNGKFTDDQKLIYNAVLAATYDVEAALKPGVYFPDMHELAYRTILTHLTEGGLLIGDVDEMMAVNLGAVFMPHGLGHSLGIDTHDCGGYPEGEKRDTRAGYKSIRLHRHMKEGMVFTVEPGCYFNAYLLAEAKENAEQSKFINWEAMERFRGFGGVRIEDDCVMRATHVEVMTRVPRTIEDIEGVMAGTITSAAELTHPNYDPAAAGEGAVGSSAPAAGAGEAN